MQQPDRSSDSGPVPSSDRLAPGDVIAGQYVVEHAIGSGGMGEVVAARPTAGGDLVAVKVMLARDRDAGGLTKRFSREVRTISAIDSPHVARLLDSGTLDDGRPFLVLELLEGEGVEELIRRRAPLPVDEAIGVVLQACEGVAEAHARGIVHRDLKPSNLFCCDIEGDEPLVKVLDFGIAKPTLSLEMDSAETSLTRSDSLLGSPQYMSPEQIRSAREVDGRTDIWALGVIAFKLLTGKLAFDARTVGEHFAMVLSDQPTALRDERPEAPLELERIILRCLEKTPTRRFRDVAALALALAPFGPPGSGKRVDRIERLIEGARASMPSLGGAFGSDDELTATEDSTANRTMGEAPTVPDTDLSTDRPLARAVQVPTSEPSEPDGSADWSDPPAGARRSQRWIGGALLAALAAGGLWILLRTDIDSATTAATPDGGATTAAATPGSEAAPEPPPTSIRLRLQVTPPEARAELDGRTIAHEEPLALPYDEGEHHLMVSAPGYVSSEHTFGGDRDRYLEVILDPLPTPSATAAAPRWPARPPPPIATAPSATAPPTSLPAPPPPPPASSPKPIDVGGPIEEKL